MGTCVESGNKRSLALTYGRCDDRDKILENFPDHKYYTWGTGAPCDVERFVAMVWGGRNDYLNQIAAARQTIQTQPLNSRWVLGPNECDIGSQCNMSIREVAVLWKQMEDALLPYGAKLVFPVPTDAGADDDWIWKVVGMYRELYGRLPTVQRFALHAYMPPSGSNEPAGLLKEFIDRQVAKLATGGGQDNLDGPCGFGMQSEQCVFDTRSVFNNDGSVWESITANGRYYNYVDKKGRWTNGRTLTSVDRYKSGPCAGKADDECRFETRTVFDYQGGRLESITAYGKYYNFHNGDPWPSNGNPLANVPRYYEKNSIVGPCYYQTGDECRFDTRTVFYDDIGQRVESITAYGRFFKYTNGNPWSSNGTMLTDPKVRYISGPCAGKEGDECIFDSRTVTARPDGSKTESITAYGKYYNYTSGAAWASNGSSLLEVDRYDDVRIYKGAAFADQKYWLTEFATACWQNYSPLETRAFMQDALPWLDQHPGIERYFWFTNRIYGDEWWGAGWQSCGLINPTTNQLELHGRYYADK